MSRFIEVILVYFQPNILRMFFLGVSAGLPLLLIFSSLSLWLRDLDLSLKVIGFFSLAKLCFSFKFLWAPLLDYFYFPIFGRRFGLRKTWLLFSQFLIVLILFSMGWVNPVNNLYMLVVLVVLLAFFTATQDICIDAWRIEAVEVDAQGAMASVYIVGYRIGMLLSSALLLKMVHYWKGFDMGINQPWQWGYWMMSALMGIGILTTFSIQEVNRSLKHSIVVFDLHFFVNLFLSPIVDFFKRYGVYAMGLLLLAMTLRLSDVLLGVFSSVFYRDMGFTLDQIANYSKTYGLLVTLIGGGILGGVVVRFLGIYRSLFLSAFLSAITNLLFIWLSHAGGDTGVLIVVISLDNLSGGIANLVSIAFLSSLVNRQYSATQYAVFSSVITILPQALGGSFGFIIESIGYSYFFLITTLLGLPALFLIYFMREKILQND